MAKKLSTREKARRKKIAANQKATRASLRGATPAGPATDLATARRIRAAAPQMRASLGRNAVGRGQAEILDKSGAGGGKRAQKLAKITARNLIRGRTKADGSLGNAES